MTETGHQTLLKVADDIKGASKKPCGLQLNSVMMMNSRDTLHVCLYYTLRTVHEKDSF